MKVLKPYKHLFFKGPISAVLVYIATLFIIYVLLDLFGFIYTVPNNTNLLNWDAKWYFSIKDSGYEFIENSMCNLAFFPLFPLVWDVLDVSPTHISIFNSLVFFISFIFFYRKEYTNLLSFLFILSIPSFIFFALPYSESLFFISSSLIILGYNKESNSLKNIGFLFSSMTRSVSIIFIPAIIICDLVLNKGKLKLN